MEKKVKMSVKGGAVVDPDSGTSQILDIKNCGNFCESKSCRKNFTVSLHGTILIGLW